MKCLRTTAAVLLLVTWSLGVYVLGVATAGSVASHPIVAGTRASNANDLALDHILLFGDSITAYSARATGFSSQIRQEYNHKLDTLIRGFVGLNTHDALPLVVPVIKSTSPSSPKAKTSLITIMIGSNDATSPEIKGAHVPLAEYKKNLKAIVANVKSISTSTRVVLISPPFMSVKFMMHRTSETIKLYRDACLEVGKEILADGSKWSAQNFTVLDSWDALLGSDGAGDKGYEMSKVMDLFEDGLHFSAKGNERMGKSIIERVRQQWPDLRKENIPNRLPEAKWIKENP
ncbi:SGNH hydrolase-type esterase domain-containing protein [Obelidium mucronatum]|nr:SGNH hydrolase-type esterase domain-containing protein [Obelidium mucronatum]